MGEFVMEVERYKDLPEGIYNTFDEMTDRAYELFGNKNYETVIKLSKLKLLWFGAMVLVLIWGLLTLINGTGILQCVMAVVSMLVSGLIVYMEGTDIRLINKPRLILSDQGITDSEGQFYTWSAVSEEKITFVGNYKPNYFLSFSASGRNRKLHLSGLNKSPWQIMGLIEQYRQLQARPAHQ